MAQSGGAEGLMHLSALESASALAQPQMMNGYEIRATVDEQEHVILQVAASEIDREEFTMWLRTHVVAKE
jgi:prophage maintenance system killer protein